MEPLSDVSGYEGSRVELTCKLSGKPSPKILWYHNGDEIFEPPVGETPLWQHVTVTALFAIGADESAIKESLQQICNILKTLRKTK
jgi:hypothetical protein